MGPYNEVIFKRRSRWDRTLHRSESAPLVYGIVYLPYLGGSGCAVRKLRSKLIEAVEMQRGRLASEVVVYVDNDIVANSRFDGRQGELAVYANYLPSEIIR